MNKKDLNQLAQLVYKEWQDDPNVLGVRIGFKRRGNSILPNPALCFTVRRKYGSVKEIRAAGSKPIPEEIEGVQTDLYAIRITGSTKWAGGRGEKAYSPLVGGCSTAPLPTLTLSFPIHGGTLGGVCYQGGKPMAISNGHVWTNDLGCDIVQPAMPVKKFLTSTLELLACGPLIAYIAEEAAPSALTAGLATAAAAVWAWAAAADDKDPPPPRAGSHPPRLSGRDDAGGNGQVRG
jgi:hypothetical protein